MDVGNTTLYALVILIVNGGILWIREYRKHRTWRGNGRDLKEIKDDVKDNSEKLDGLDEKVGETNIQVAQVKTAVNGQKSQCAATVKRFDKTITDQGKEIIRLAWKKENKR